MTLKEKAAAVFARQNDTQELFATADGYLFGVKTQAEAHAATLANRNVQTINREQEEVPEPQVSEPASAEPLIADAQNAPDIEEEMQKLNTSSEETNLKTNKKKK